MSDGSIEPDFVFLKNTGYTFSMFGVFVAYFVILVRSLRSKPVGAEWFILFPIILLIAFNFLPREFELPINYILKFLDFPVSFIECYYYVRLVCFLSRFSLDKLNPPVSQQEIRRGKLLPSRKSLSYRAVISIISVVSLTIATALVSYGFKYWALSWYHGVVAAGVVFAFLFTIVCDNGIISDPCMISLHTALSVVPMISLSAGFFTVFLRLFLVISAFASLKSSLEDSASNKMEGFSFFFTNFKKKQTATAFLLLLLTFVFLSPEAFIRPVSKICGWQAMICPIIYIFFLLVEARQYHVATPYLRH